MSTIHEMLIANKPIANKPIDGTAKTGASAKRRSRAKAAGRHVFSNSEAHVTETDRQQMIADNAYFRAERRDFAPGSEMVDWLEADAEIDRYLDRNPGRQAIN
ncbi:MAG TPA: DUF2934 domain-containing protein [Methylophilaceae bacterium]|nr:DUF2934 domain-containing protein [Methylophilaceae bacterium]